MKPNVPMLLASSAFILSACGGGTSGAATPPTNAPSTPPPTSSPGFTAARGTLVDDPSGTALPGVPVRLDPWISYPTPGPSPTPIATSTTDPDGHFTISAKNGTYMLVIGSDNSSDTKRPTIHDKIVLNGQPLLAAPTMPPLPGVTPPPVESSGNYRLANIDATLELPCIQEYDAQRTALSLQLPVVDEWLTENVRAAVAQSQTSYKGDVFATNMYGFLTTANIKATGGTTCKDVVDSAFTLPNQYAISVGAAWLSASYLGYQGGVSSAYGLAEFPYDPRLYTDPNALSWP